MSPYLKKGLCGCDEVKALVMRSSKVQLTGRFNPMIHILVEAEGNFRKRRSCVKTEADTGGMYQQAKRMLDPQKLKEMRMDLLLEPMGRVSLLSPESDSAPQNSGRIHFCCFKLPQ